MADQPNTQEPRKRQQGGRRQAPAQSSPAVETETVTPDTAAETAAPEPAVEPELELAPEPVQDSEPALPRERLLSREGELFVGARAHHIAAALHLDPEPTQFTRSRMLELIEQYKTAPVQGSHLDEHPADLNGSADTAGLEA